MTKEQRNAFNLWVDSVIDHMYFSRKPSRILWVWMMECEGKFDNWCDKLFFFGKTPEQAAAIIQRAYKLYINR